MEDHSKIVGEGLKKMITKLVSMSKADKHDVFNDISWPDQLDDNQFWISRHLISLYNTPLIEQVSEEELYRLSKEECVNFFSLNVHGIRELLLDVMQYIHQPKFEVVSEFLHHFIDEENEHMFFFAKFCQKYAGKIYDDKFLKYPTDNTSGNVRLFFVFMRIWTFEMIVDYYNSQMANDKSLHPFIQEINGLHHKDESRHIAFGGKLLQSVFKDLLELESSETINSIRTYTQNYIKNRMGMFYNPYAYKAAGIEDFFSMRNVLLENEGRREMHKEILKGMLNKLYDYEIILDKNIYS
ncbi:para-aminobenzoate N-oxygenase AurF [Chitinophaga niastensis]|uniref:Para-aminobenzoate N-oxygenase AurF n=1 Tax=Chitinophaga niastensis TaxID=536980 RepID=A0A2P8H990_CHINA|nr:diiron oxygenase [Chitinophaga niastensis]PSL42792.1 para-aminobenzoate N-oxygenase AurF [Chitinophaga niastensis]